MATTTSTDPFRNFLFRVEIDGIQTAAFSEATMPEGTVDAVDYPEDTNPAYIRQLGGLDKFGNLTLKKGLTTSMDLYDWQQLVWNEGPDAAGARKNISLILMDADGMVKARWNIINAWVSNYESTGLNAGSNEAMVETFALKMEDMIRAA